MTVVPGRQKRLKQAFERVTGHWQQRLKASPQYFEAFIDCIEVVWKNRKTPCQSKIVNLHYTQPAGHLTA